MRFTTSLLADAASQADGKLYILGAGWDTITASVFPTVQPSIAVILVIEFDPEEVDPSEFDLHDFEINLVDEEGMRLSPSAKGLFELKDPQKLAPGVPIRQPLAVTFVNVSLPRAGGYKFAVLVNGAQVHSLDFFVRSAQKDA